MEVNNCDRKVIQTPAFSVTVVMKCTDSPSLNREIEAVPNLLKWIMLGEAFFNNRSKKNQNELFTNSE